MTDDLVRRLREPLCANANDVFCMSKAADVIEAQAKRIAELEALITRVNDDRARTFLDACIAIQHER